MGGWAGSGSYLCRRGHGRYRRLRGGKASWDGRSLRWSTSEEVTYDIPDSLARQIRPRIPNMNRSGEPLEGFSYFALVAVSPDVSSNSPELVRHYLERSKSV